MTKTKQIKHYFSMLEIIMVTAVIASVFAITALLIDSTKESVINMSIQDNLATNGMDIMNQIKQDVSQSAVIFTPDAPNDSNHYLNLVHFNQQYMPYGDLRLPYEGTTMDINSPDYNPNDAGNMIFMAKELEPYNLVIKSNGTPSWNFGFGFNMWGHNPMHPAKKMSVTKTGANINHNFYDHWFNFNGALIEKDDSNYNLKRFQFIMYYLSEIKGKQRFPNTNGGFKNGYLNLILAKSELYGDFNDVNNLDEPERSKVIKSMMTPVSQNGAGITVFWSRSVTNPFLNTPFYTFVRMTSFMPYMAMPLMFKSITFKTHKELLNLSGTLSSGNFSVVYNDTTVNRLHAVPKFGPKNANYPAGFEVILSGNKRNRRVLTRLVTAVAEGRTIISDVNQMLSPASEVAATSGIFFFIPRMPHP